MTNHDSKANYKDAVVRGKAMATCILELFLFNISMESSSGSEGRLVPFPRIAEVRNSFAYPFQL